MSNRIRPTNTTIRSNLYINRSAKTAFHFEFDEAVEFDRVLDWEFLRDGFDEPAHDHLFRVVVVQSAALEVEHVLVADFTDRCLVGDVHAIFVDFHVRHGVRRGFVVEHQRVTFDRRGRIHRAVADVDEAAVVRATAVLADGFRLDGGVGAGRVVVHFRAGVDVLSFASECD